MITSFALDGMDRRLLPHISRHPGTFVEAGAHDGLTQSNTALLEFAFGWSGLLVEPIPALADLCRRNRPGSRVEQAALVPPEYAEGTIAMTYCNRSSIVACGRGSPDADAAWLDACRRIPDQREVEPYAVTVPVATLSALLDRHGLAEVDFLSLDLEGYEGPALRGLDFTRHRPTLLLVEFSNDADAVQRVLDPWYEPVEELSDHRTESPPWYDVLYRALDRTSPRSPS
jgi:FkbM family methyltransferase